MAIKLSEDHRAGIEAEGERVYPNECCGFLLGRLNGDRKEVVRISPVHNAFEEDEQYHRYTISPEDFVEGERLARDEGLDIIGFFHSHPDVAARPSDYDREHAWPWYSYVIVSVQKGQAAEMTSWVLEDDRSRMSEEELEITV